LGNSYAIEYVKKHKKFCDNIEKLNERLKALTDKLTVYAPTISQGFEICLIFNDYTIDNKIKLAWYCTKKDLVNFVESLERLNISEIDSKIKEISKEFIRRFNTDSKFRKYSKVHCS